MQQVIAELAPAKLGQEFFNVAPNTLILLGDELRRMPDLERADLAEAQMRRQPRGSLIVGAIAARRVAFETLGQELFKARAGAGLTSRPFGA